MPLSDGIDFLSFGGQVEEGAFTILLEENKKERIEENKFNKKPTFGRPAQTGPKRARCVAQAARLPDPGAIRVTSLRGIFQRGIT